MSALERIGKPQLMESNQEATELATKLIAARACDMFRHYVEHILPNGLKAQVVAYSRVHDLSSWAGDPRRSTFRFRAPRRVVPPGVVAVGEGPRLPRRRWASGRVGAMLIGADVSSPRRP